MNSQSIAPCGLNCALCWGFQRSKKTCSGCNISGAKTHYCTVCRIKTWPEKNGKDRLSCRECPRYPCKRLKDLDKRYRFKYGESAIENFRSIAEIGLSAFVAAEEIKWRCPQCGNLVCVHREKCLTCGEANPHFPPNPGKPQRGTNK